MTFVPPHSVILLAAGTGSRLAPLSDSCHKSLLPLGAEPALHWILESVISSEAQEIVVVTGHRKRDIQEFVAERFGNRIFTVDNPGFAEYGNILSVDIAVESLQAPDQGYLIIETDVFIEPEGWKFVLELDNTQESFWVTKSCYSTVLTGGALRASSTGWVDQLVYAPRYESAYEGFSKLLGVLYVGEENVSLDRKLRKDRLDSNPFGYYMEPWSENLDRLPCRARDLGDWFAFSFNDSLSYHQGQNAVDSLFRQPGIESGRNID